MRFGEELAALIPDSRLVALSSNNHLLTATEPAWQVFRDEVDAFLAELSRRFACASARDLHAISIHSSCTRPAQRSMLVT